MDEKKNGFGHYGGKSFLAWDKIAENAIR